MPNEKLITIRFTERELYELDCLLANGVCDYADPSNKVASSAYEKISRGRSKFRTKGGDNAAE